MNESNMMAAELHALDADVAKHVTTMARDGAKSRRSTIQVVEDFRERGIPDTACFGPAYEGDDCTSSVEFRESLVAAILEPLTKIQKDSYRAPIPEVRLMTRPQKEARKEAQQHVKDTLNSMRQALKRRQLRDARDAEEARREALAEAAQNGDEAAKAELAALLEADDLAAFEAAGEAFWAVLRRFQNAEHGPLSVKAREATPTMIALGQQLGWAVPDDMKA